MKMIKIEDLFDISYGNGFSLNQLTQAQDGVNFISRTAKNNGVSGRVIPINNIKPYNSNTITVSLGGSVLESFLQTEPFYSGYHIYCLTPKIELTQQEMLYYCTCIRANKYRYSYGRQANRTLKDILIPDPDEIPSYVNEINLTEYDNIADPVSNEILELIPEQWKEFYLSELFDISLGKPLHKNNIDLLQIDTFSTHIDGSVPYITRTARNNGVELFVKKDDALNEFISNGNAIIVGAEGFKPFYQKFDFLTGNKINILRNNNINEWSALFICGVLNIEISKKFSYGRGIVKSRMSELKIKLPSTSGDEPDWEYMESYIKTLPFSKVV